MIYNYYKRLLISSFCFVSLTHLLYARLQFSDRVLDCIFHKPKFTPTIREKRYVLLLQSHPSSAVHTHPGIFFTVGKSFRVLCGLLVCINLYLTLIARFGHICAPILYNLLIKFQFIQKQLVNYNTHYIYIDLICIYFFGKKYIQTFKGKLDLHSLKYT